MCFLLDDLMSKTIAVTQISLSIMGPPPLTLKESSILLVDFMFVIATVKVSADRKCSDVCFLSR